MARGWLEAEGVRVRGLSRDEIATRALHSTSDFPAILAGVTNKTLRNAYDTAPRTYPAIARRTTVADFKLVHRLQLGEAPQLEKVNQSGEFKRGTIGEAQETYRIETFGKVIGITRQVLINDDLDAFTRVPALFGTSAATLESDVVWGIFTANPAMADGTTLFHASHKNLAGAGAALDVAGLAKARTAMAQQRGLDGKTLLNVRPPTWWCRARWSSRPSSSWRRTSCRRRRRTWCRARSAASRSSPSRGSTRPRVPCPGSSWRARRRSTPSSTPTSRARRASRWRPAWASTSTASRSRARLDFGAKAIDWRGLYKNPGVALS